MVDFSPQSISVKMLAAPDFCRSSPGSRKRVNMAVVSKSQPFIGLACAEGMVSLPVTAEEKAALPAAGQFALPDRLTLAAFAGFVLIVGSAPLAINAIAMTAGSLILLAGSYILEETPALPVSSGVWLAYLYLGTLVTVGTFGLYMFTLSRWTASGASYAFVLAPIVTVILAASLVGEAVTPVFMFGGALVLFGVWVGVLSGNASRKKDESRPSGKLEKETSPS